MGLEPLSALAVLIVLAVVAEWVAERIGVPSIVVLLLFGFLVGPVTGLVNPDVLLGDTLFPIVSLSVAIILFEGGMNLRWVELRPVRRPVLALTTLGVATTWGLSSLLAWWLLGFDPSVALLLGAILIITGPTVIVPMLRDIDVDDEFRTVAMWEAIVNDPLGAVAAISVFELAVSRHTGPGLVDAGATLLVTIVVGILVAVVGVGLLVLAMHREWIPAFLEVPVTLGLVVGSFALAESFTPEAGLIAAVGMGIAVANQDLVETRRISRFKETLGLILVAVLFVTLAARFELSGFRTVTVESFVFLGLLIGVVRPAAVMVAGLPSGLGWRKLMALSFVAPRGIVAAALGPLFALKLVHEGHPEARQLDGEIYFVIAGTVIFYGIVAKPVLSRLVDSDQGSPGG